MNQPSDLEATVEQLLELEQEREVSAHASTGGAELDSVRAALHEWVDSVVGVVASAGSGRVTLIHADGRRSGIASADLAYKVTPPVKWEVAE